MPRSKKGSSHVQCWQLIAVVTKADVIGVAVGKKSCFGGGVET